MTSMSISGLSSSYSLPLENPVPMIKRGFHPPSSVKECDNFFRLIHLENEWVEKWNAPNFDKSEAFRAAQKADLGAQMAILGAILHWFETKGPKTVFDLAAEHQYDINSALTCLEPFANSSFAISLLISDLKFHLAEDKYAFIATQLDQLSSHDEASLILKMKWLFNIFAFEQISGKQYSQIVENVHAHCHSLPAYVLLAVLHLSAPHADAQTQMQSLTFLRELANQNSQIAALGLSQFYVCKPHALFGNIAETIKLYKQLLSTSQNRLDFLQCQLQLLEIGIATHQDRKSILKQIKELQTASDRIQINSDVRACDIANTYLAKIYLKEAQSRNEIYQAVSLLEYPVKRGYPMARHLISALIQRDALMKDFLQKAKHRPIIKQGYRVASGHLKPLLAPFHALNIDYNDLKTLYQQINFEVPQAPGYTNPWKLGGLLFGQKAADESLKEIKKRILKQVEHKLLVYLPKQGQNFSPNLQSEAYQAYVKLTHLTHKIQAMPKLDANSTLIQLLIECNGCPDQQMKGIDKLFNEMVQHDLLRSPVVDQIDRWAFDLRKAVLEQMANNFTHQLSFLRRLIGRPAGAIMEFEELNEALQPDWFKPMPKQSALDAFHQLYHAEALVNGIYMQIESLMAIQAMKDNPRRREALAFLRELFKKATDELGLKPEKVLDLAKSDPESDTAQYIFAKEGIWQILHRLGRIEKTNENDPIEFESEDFSYCMQDTSWI